MSSRYVKYFEFENEIYTPVCPVALEKGAVLLDTKTNTYVLQLKLANIGEEIIAETRVFVKAFDRNDSMVYEVSGSYDEHVAVGSSFGTKTLLPIPNNSAVAFKVYVTRTVANNGSVYSFTEGRDAELQKVDESGVVAKKEAAVAEVGRKRQYASQKQQKAKKWLHVLFAVNVVLLLFSFIWPISYITWRFHLRVFSLGAALFAPQSLEFLSWLVLALFIALLVSAWLGISKSSVIKRTRRMAIIMPIGYIVLFPVGLLIIWLWRSSIGNRLDMTDLFAYAFDYAFFNTNSVIAFVLFVFVCVAPYLIVRKNEIIVTKTPQHKGNSPILQDIRMSNAAKANDTPFTEFCFHCGEEVEGEADFCSKCGGSLNG